MKWPVSVVVSVLALALIWGVFIPVAANRYTSPNYVIDASNAGASINAITSGGNYKMIASGGESIVGKAQGGSYRLEQGYIAQLPYSLELTVNTPSVSIPEVTPGSSQTGDAEISLRSTSPQYSVSISQSADLTSGESSIPAISVGSITSPALWDEGSTKGLGVTLANLSFGELPAKWSSGDAYAAIPSTATTLFSRNGLSGGTLADTATVRFRLDVNREQVAGDYSNTVSYIATWLP